MTNMCFNSMVTKKYFHNNESMNNQSSDSKQQGQDVTKVWPSMSGRPTLPMDQEELAKLGMIHTSTPNVGTVDAGDISTGKEMAERTRAVLLPNPARDYPSAGFETPGDVTRDVRVKVSDASNQALIQPANQGPNHITMWTLQNGTQDKGKHQNLPLIHDEYDEGDDVMDPEASTRSIKEYVFLLANLDERLDVTGKQNDQVRMILDELKPHLRLLRRDARRTILQAYPVLFYPDQILPAIEAIYPKNEEVMPGLSKFQVAVRELGKALSLTFKRETFTAGIEKLKTLKGKEYNYTFEDFRDTLVRMDDEAPRFTDELRFWLMQLSPQEKDAIGEHWIPPARPEDMVTHIKSMYPEPWHNYILQVVGERLNSLFAHSSIPDNAKVDGFKREGVSQRIITEAQNVAMLWRGGLKVAENPPKRITGRITDRINQARV